MRQSGYTCLCHRTLEGSTDTPKVTTPSRLVSVEMSDCCAFVIEKADFGCFLAEILEKQKEKLLTDSPQRENGPGGI
jgi:hypothetical protein